MIYRLIMISDEVDGFMREIQIDADATFFDLHEAILKACDYEDNQMTLFTMCKNGWEMGQQITLEVMDTASDEDCYVMKETHLNEFLEDERQHFLYTFDPLAERHFFFELSEIITGKHLAAPKVTRKEGNPPTQALDFEELFARNPIQTESTLDLDDDGDLYGDGIDDEVDLDGLDISDGNPYE